MVGRLAGVFALVAVLAACGSTGSTGSSGSTSGTEPTMTVRGTVSAGVEAGCLLFVPEPGGVLSGAPTGGPTGTGMGTRMGMGMGARRGPWVLVGRTAGIEAGSTVTVRGVPAPGMTTTCQQGTPFRVEAVVG